MCQMVHAELVVKWIIQLDSEEKLRFHMRVGCRGWNTVQYREFFITRAGSRDQLGPKTINNAKSLHDRDYNCTRGRTLINIALPNY